MRCYKWQEALAKSYRLFQKGFGINSVSKKLHIGHKEARHLYRIFLATESDFKARFSEREEIIADFNKYYLWKSGFHTETTIKDIYDAIASANVGVARKAEFLLQYFPNIKQIFIPLPDGGMAEWNCWL